MKIIADVEVTSAAIINLFQYFTEVEFSVKILRFVAKMLFSFLLTDFLNK